MAQKLVVPGPDVQAHFRHILLPVGDAAGHVAPVSRSELLAQTRNSEYRDLDHTSVVLSHPTVGAIKLEVKKLILRPATVCWLMTDAGTCLARGVALCGVGENFNRKIGRAISLGRARKILTYPGLRPRVLSAKQPWILHESDHCPELLPWEVDMLGLQREMIQ